MVNYPTITCPDSGTWRSWLDGEAGAEQRNLSDHLLSCTACRVLVSELRTNAALAATAAARLKTEPPPAAEALLAMRASLGLPPPAAAPAPATVRQIPTPIPTKIKEKRTMTTIFAAPRWRLAMSGLAAALMLSAFLGTAQGRGAAAQFLAQFRGERFAEVPLTTKQIANVEQTLEELERLGTVQGLEDSLSAMRPAATVDEAARITGLDVRTPDPATLPSGVSGTPTAIMALPAGEVRFTFDREKARAYYASIGRSDLTLPDRFHGATLVIQTPPAVLMRYSRTGAAPDSLAGLGLLVGQAGTLSAGVEGGVTLAELRDFLLGLPSLSPETARQLRAIEDWQTSLPLPLPVDFVGWERATLAGAPGLLLADNSGLGSAAIWQRDGRIYGVAGPVKSGEVRRVADGLR